MFCWKDSERKSGEKRIFDGGSSRVPEHLRNSIWLVGRLLNSIRVDRRRLQRDSLSPLGRGWKLASRINARIASGVFTAKGGQSRKVASKMSNLSRVTLSFCAPSEFQTVHPLPFFFSFFLCVRQICSPNIIVEYDNTVIITPDYALLPI